MTELISSIKQLNSIDDLTQYMALNTNRQNTTNITNDDMQDNSMENITNITNVTNVTNVTNITNVINDKKLSMVKNKIKNTNHYGKDIFCPREKDQLFWCFYVLLNDVSSYYDNRAKSFTIEHEFKIQSIEKMRRVDFKDKMKIHRIRLSVVEDELANAKKITATTLKALCLLYDQNMIIVNPLKRTYYICGSNVSSSNIIYYENEQFYIKNNNEKNNNEKNNNKTSDLNRIIKEYYLLENLDKPIKSMASYSAPELQNIARKLNIELLIGKKSKTKQQLYSEILERL